MSHDKKPSSTARILFFLLGAVGFVLIFSLGLWLTVDMPSVAPWIIQALVTIVFIYGFTYRLGIWLGILPEKIGALEMAAIRHPLSYYVMSGISLICLLFTIGFFILIVGGTYWATR